MIVQEPTNERVRAWILVRAESAQAAATAQYLYENLGQRGDDSWVVVRANVIDYYYNIIVPVDAESLDVLHKVIGMIQELTRASEIAVLRVVDPIPDPPHSADGFITSDEERRYPSLGAKVGRQKKSPGHNPWG